MQSYFRFIWNTLTMWIVFVTCDVTHQCKLCSSEPSAHSLCIRLSTVLGRSSWTLLPTQDLCFKVQHLYVSSSHNLLFEVLISFIIRFNRTILTAYHVLTRKKVCSLFFSLGYLVIFCRHFDIFIVLERYMTSNFPAGLQKDHNKLFDFYTKISH